MTEHAFTVVGHLIGARSVTYAEVYAYHAERQRRIDAGEPPLTADEWNSVAALRERVMITVYGSPS